MTFQQQLAAYAAATEDELTRQLPLEDCPQRELQEAMAYSALGGGKRLRAALILAFCESCGGRMEDALPLAAAVEMAHAYSLIHDDLPCMDDDDLRRGKPSCHKAFGEATALLAGDALLTRCFEVLLHCESLPPQRLLAAGACLSTALGQGGMIGGQVMDLANEHLTQVDEARLRATDHKKTGALIAAACKLGCIAAGAGEEQCQAAEAFGYKIGLAFQITDDMLDVSSSTEELGKPVGSDSQQQKNTYVSLYGLEGAGQRAEALLAEAAEDLRASGLSSPFLQELCTFILVRKN